jgi:hypothetical protein
LLEHESGMRDLAAGEELEIDMGESPDIRVQSTQVDTATQVDISNSRNAPVQFELRLQLPPSGRITHADHPMAVKNGRPIFRVTIPANQTVTMRYYLQQANSGRAPG